MAETTWNTERIVRLVALALLGIACLQVLLPFLVALIWAGIISITIWPFFVWLTRRLGNRPVWAATLCSLGLIALLVMPFALMTATLGQAIPQVAALIKQLTLSIAPEPPAWLGNLPGVGALLIDLWKAAATDMAGMIRKALPAAESAGVWALAQGANLVLAVLQFLFAILLSGLLLVTADRSTDLAKRLVAKLDIERGGGLLEVGVTTVRSVSIGLVGTGTVQALAGAIGFVISGVPGFALLSFMIFLLGLIQIPTALVWAPAAVWLYFQGQVGWAIFLGIYGLVIINSVDNVLRPYLISRGAKLPFALIFMGVLGGLLAWGIIGLFIGPTLLAVAFSLIRAWMGEAAGPAGPAVAPTDAPPAR